MPKTQKGSPTDELDKQMIAAAEDFHRLDGKAVEVVAKWWNKWYLRTGHKRLGRLLGKTEKRRRNKQPTRGRSNGKITFDPLISARVVDNGESCLIRSIESEDLPLFSFGNTYPNIEIRVNKTHPFGRTFWQCLSDERLANREEYLGVMSAFLVAWWNVEHNHELDSSRALSRDIRYDVSRAMSNSSRGSRVQLVE